ncbi:MAG: hypothetical protein JW795_14895 [Chitinivibrionales bacterium]|nr:hypothetical protein [Chitinivibrionales bacterium]
MSQLRESEKRRDAIREFFNIGIGKSAQLLNDIFKSHVILTIPQVTLIGTHPIGSDGDPVVQSRFCAVGMSFHGDLNGDAYLLFLDSDVPVLLKPLIDEGGTALSETVLHNNILLEIGNIVINSLVGSISNILQLSVFYTLPQLQVATADSLNFLAQSGAKNYAMRADTVFQFERFKVCGYIILFMDLYRFEEFFKTIQG